MIGQLKPDLLFVTLIHQALRVDADRLATATSALRSGETEHLTGLRAFFDEYREQLYLHHAHEDSIFFPALNAVFEVDRVALAELSIQHEGLDSDLRSISDGLASLAHPSGDGVTGHTDVVNTMFGLAAHLDAHLTMEEETIVKQIESTLSPATYKQLEAQARKRTPRRRAQFLIPWLVTHATSAQQKALFKSAPLLRAAYLVNRRRYRLLDRALAC